MARDGFAVGKSAGAEINTVYVKVGNTDWTEAFPTHYSASTPILFCSSPVETGEEHIDHKVVRPRVIDFTAIVKKDKFKLITSAISVAQSMSKKDTLCSFYAKSGDFVANCLIEDFREVGTANRYDAVEVHIRLRELLEV